MKKIIACLFLFSFADVSMAQVVDDTPLANGHSLKDMYTSDLAKQRVEKLFNEHIESFAYIDTNMAIKSIQDKIDQGYNSVDTKTGLQGYIDEIEKNANDKEKVKELYYKAIMGAIPPRSLIIDTQDKLDYDSQHTIANIERNLGMSIEEYTEVIEQQKNTKSRPLPNFDD